MQTRLAATEPSVTGSVASMPSGLSTYVNATAHIMTALGEQRLRYDATSRDPTHHLPPSCTGLTTDPTSNLQPAASSLGISVKPCMATVMTHSLLAGESRCSVCSCTDDGHLPCYLSIR